MFFFIKKTPQKIPQYIRDLYTPFARKAINQIQKYIQKIRDFVYPTIFIFDGLEKNSKLPLTFVYIGSAFSPERESYWSQISLTDDHKKHDMGRHFAWDVFLFLRKSPFKCDFLLMEDYTLNLLSLCHMPGFEIPHWISTELNISAPIEKLLGSERREIQRKIRKSKLSYAMANDKESFDDFYYNMFLPYVKTRYDSAAISFSHQYLSEVYSKGGLLLINKEDKIVAGSLYEFIDQKPKGHSFGIREGKWEFVQDGVLGAAYYFMIVEMKKRGYTKFLLGGTRPFLKDGLTKHKISLNAYFIKDKKRPSVWLGLLKSSAGLKNFLINNPFIFLDWKKNLYSAFFGEIDEVKLSQEVEKDLKLSCNGLKRTFLFTFNKLSIGKDENLLKDCPFTVKFMEDMIIK